MFWRPALRCDVAHCPRSSGEQIEPLVRAAGFRFFEIDGVVNGREYTGQVLLCPEHVVEMNEFIWRCERGDPGPGLLFESFGGGYEKEPVYA